MKILLGSDHAGFELKEKIKTFLINEGFGVEDMGASAYVEGDDYPQILLPLAMRIVSEPETYKGIVFGKSGQGEAIICNRFPGVRAVVYYGQNKDIVRLSREHNDSNVLSLGAGFVEAEEAQEAVKLWLSTTFSADPRHIRRNEMLDTIQ